MGLALSRGVGVRLVGVSQRQLRLPGYSALFLTVLPRSVVQVALVEALRPVRWGSFVFSICRSSAPRKTAHMILSILTHISHPTHFCSSVMRLHEMHRRSDCGRFQGKEAIGCFPRTIATRGGDQAALRQSSKGRLQRPIFAVEGCGYNNPA